VSCLTASSADRNDAGATRKPILSVGNSTFEKRSDIDHPARSIEALQRIEWPAVEAELAVVVVFDDHSPSAFGPRKEARRVVEMTSPCQEEIDVRV
jgi:hypothetical protein